MVKNPEKGLISSEWAPATAFPRFFGDLEETFVGNKSFHSTLDHRDVSFSKISQIDIKILCPDFEIPWFHMEEIGILWISIVLKVFACGCAFSTTVSSKSKSSQQQEHRLPMPALRWWKGATCWCFTLSILGVVGEPQMISAKIHDHSGAKQKKTNTSEKDIMFVVVGVEAIKLTKTEAKYEKNKVYKIKKHKPNPVLNLQLLVSQNICFGAEPANAAEGSCMEDPSMNPWKAMELTPKLGRCVQTTSVKHEEETLYKKDRSNWCFFTTKIHSNPGWLWTWLLWVDSFPAAPLADVVEFAFQPLACKP